MSNKFCRFLSNGASISIENEKLVARPCCWSSHRIEFDDEFDKHRLKHWIKIKDWTPGCSVCEQQERSGSQSFRQSSFNIVSESKDFAISALDINIDMTCNAACVMCGPGSSTTWTTQFNKFKIPLVPINYNFSKQLTLLSEKIDLTNLQRIKFFGGEPLLTETHMKVLEQIPNPERCDIWYTTNGSVVPSQEVLDMWQKFKLVFVEISIDGVAEQFEYIRWPLTWNKIERNIIKLKEIVPVNVLFRINHTLNPLNVFYYDRIEDWILKNFSTNRLGDPVEINIHPCWGDWALDRTPVKLREEIYKKFPNHQISNMIKTCDVNDPETLLEFTKKWDPIRNLYWEDIFPEIKQYF